MNKKFTDLLDDYLAAKAFRESATRSGSSSEYVNATRAALDNFFAEKDSAKATASTTDAGVAG